MPKGYIKNWRRDRGFGFINVDGQEDDVFVHISELRNLGRPPRIGDEITFEIETQENGKNRAINCNVKGQSGKSPSNAPGSIESKKPMIVTAIVVAAILVAWFILK